MWRSQIEHLNTSYSTTYFECITEFDSYSAKLLLGQGSYVLRKTYQIYIARMSPALSGCPALWGVKLGDVLKIHD